jgi:hypothetical protein
MDRQLISLRQFIAATVFRQQDMLALWADETENAAHNRCLKLMASQRGMAKRTDNTYHGDLL